MAKQKILHYIVHFIIFNASIVKCFHNHIIHSSFFIRTSNFWLRLNGLIFYPYLWLSFFLPCFYFWRPNQISVILGFPSFLSVLGLANVILTLKHNFLIIPLMQFPFSFKPPTRKYLKKERAIRMRVLRREFCS